MFPLAFIVFHDTHEFVPLQEAVPLPFPFQLAFKPLGIEPTKGDPLANLNIHRNEIATAIMPTSTGVNDPATAFRGLPLLGKQDAALGLLSPLIELNEQPFADGAKGGHKSVIQKSGRRLR